MNAAEIQHEDDLLITQDVARAVEEQELVAYYQPVVSLEDSSLASLEALVRWTMPDGTIVPAALFVPSLDRTDTIFGLDWFMAEDVCAFLQQKAKGTSAFVPTCLNISGRHASDPHFAQKLSATVGWHELSKDMLRIELSEALLTSGDSALTDLVTSLVDAGFTVTADNFASNAAGLAALDALGIKQVKVSASLWKTCDKDALAALMQEAAARGISLCAEGIENEDELEAARAAGFAYAQGYHLGAPTDGGSLISSWG